MSHFAGMFRPTLERTQPVTQRPPVKACHYTVHYTKRRSGSAEITWRLPTSLSDTAILPRSLIHHSSGELATV